jgi:hypothetical protein
MSLNIKVSTSEDIEYRVALLLGDASNYSDGQTKGFRPSIRFAMVTLPTSVTRSGLFNIKNEAKQDSPAEALAIALSKLLEGDCICSDIVDRMLETWADEQ